MKSIAAPFAAAALVILSLAASHAAPVRPAPDFPIPRMGANATLLKVLDDQPAVILFANSPTSRAFKKQVRLIENDYRFFAGRDVIFVAVFSEGGDGRVKSDIPFVVVQDPTVAASYGIDKSGVAVVAATNNLDLITSEYISGKELVAILDNTLEIQAAARQ